MYASSRPSPEYTDADIREWLRLLQQERRGLQGPIPAQWRDVELYITPYVQE